MSNVNNEQGQVQVAKTGTSSGCRQGLILISTTLSHSMFESVSLFLYFNFFLTVLLDFLLVVAAIRIRTQRKI